MLQGPFLVSLTTQVEKNYAGTYILSRGGKHAHYVGRSDRDLGSRVTQSAREGRYSHFWFIYASSPREAYLKECEYFHKYEPSDNTNHPAVPPGTYWRCPVNGCEWS